MQVPEAAALLPWLLGVKKLNLSCSIFFGLAHLIFLIKDGRGEKKVKKAYDFLGGLNGLSEMQEHQFEFITCFESSKLGTT